ncbi:MAG: hypothetical protein J0M35_02020 [Candidatus Obscuribacter phosphatis]|uniref:Uncharacterized protein n=1 Tax=Candidatus Obscuribacter phosphatis TaxID=1906157 RepID=A0A8J7TJW4_9BACT|nr:hypothetical protein [Candidatus Obscuribacter phosphatis]
MADVQNSLESAEPRTQQRPAPNKASDALFDEYMNTPPARLEAKHGGDIEVHYGSDQYKDNLARGLTAAAESLEVSDVRKHLEPMSAQERAETLKAMACINSDRHANDPHGVPKLELIDSEKGLTIEAEYKSWDLFGRQLPSKRYSESIGLTPKGEVADKEEPLYNGHTADAYARAAGVGETKEIAKALESMSPEDRVKFLADVECANRKQYVEDRRGTPLLNFRVSPGAEVVDLSVVYDPHRKDSKERKYRVGVE